MPPSRVNSGLVLQNKSEYKGMGVNRGAISGDGGRKDSPEVNQLIKTAQSHPFSTAVISPLIISTPDLSALLPPPYYTHTHTHTHAS